MVDTDFTEATLAETGLSLDIPNPSLASVTLDDANDQLVFTTMGNTDMWGSRNNAPIAYVLNRDFPDGLSPMTAIGSSSDSITDPGIGKHCS